MAQFLLSGVEEDVLTPTDEAAVRAHGLATRYDPYAERLFTAVQARSLDRMFCVLLCMRFDVRLAAQGGRYCSPVTPCGRFGRCRAQMSP